MQHAELGALVKLLHALTRHDRSVQHAALLPLRHVLAVPVKQNGHFAELLLTDRCFAVADG